jgi:tripartite-type tricarboxylate transporter receptor subunit TctC
MALRIWLIVGLIVGAVFGPAAQADSWPSKPVRILVSFPPGGSSDLVARLLGKHLSDKFGQQFVVENKPGAGGTVAASALKREKGDGHTFMLSNLAPYSIAPTLFSKLPYDALKDFTHVSYIGTVYLGLFVSPKLGIKTLADFVDMAKAAPDKFDFGSSGVGSWSNVIGFQFNKMADIKLVSIPYKGSRPMRQDFRAGVIPIMFDALPQNVPALQDGTAGALAISAPARTKSNPDLATFKEQGYDIVAENWLGLTAPAGLDATIAKKIDGALAEIFKLADVQSKFDTWGLIHEPKTTAEFQAYVAGQIEKWKPLVVATGAKK